MTILFFDTETTGFVPGQICQLSYVIDDGGFQEGRNYYFTVDRIDKQAEMVHGLSVERLKSLSSGKPFGAHQESILRDFAQAEIIAAHNMRFDLGFLQHELSRCGKRLASGTTLCTMSYFTEVMQLKRSNGAYKAPSLAELMSFLNISRDRVEETARRLFGVPDTAPHDARYDSTAVMLCYQRAVDMRYITEPF